MVFKDFCVLVHWANVTSALEGLLLIMSISVTGGNEDLFEQQQAREQSHVLQRFKQLRAWQQQQQEFLMRQQQQQLEMLKSEQDRVNKMIVRQREMQWGGKGTYSPSHY